MLEARTRDRREHVSIGSTNHIDSYEGSKTDFEMLEHDDLAILR